MTARAARPQTVVRTLLPQVVEAKFEMEAAPPWLLRPGEAECGSRWQLLCEIYRTLTSRELPALAPSREHRRGDVLITYPGGQRQILEIDERQHFTDARAQTLDLYPAGVELGFDAAAWADLSRAYAGREPGGGFARPCPPLFPGPGGRHHQRAFRDALADLLPAEHGWLPTVRISETEMLTWPAGDLAGALAAGLHNKRVVPGQFLTPPGH